MGRFPPDSQRRVLTAEPRWTWLFLRLSGVLLAVVVAMHLLQSFFKVIHLEGALVHYTGAGALVVLVLSHGLVGLANVLRDQGLAPRGRVVLGWALTALGVLLALGSLRALEIL